MSEYVPVRPPKSVLSRGECGPPINTIPWACMNLHSKYHLSWFSHFCRGHGGDQQTNFTVGGRTEICYATTRGTCRQRRHTSDRCRSAGTPRHTYTDTCLRHRHTGVSTRQRPRRNLRQLLQQTLGQVSRSTHAARHAYAI